MKWALHTQYTASVRKGDRVLAITIAMAKGKFFTIAVEGPKAASLSQTKRGLDLLLADHSHQTLPVQRTFQAAQKAAEEYARGWKRKSKSHHVPCDCDEIGNNPIRASP